MTIEIKKIIHFSANERITLLNAAELLAEMSHVAEDYDDDLSQTMWDIQGSIRDLIDLDDQDISC